jgi:putative thioredoxin
MLPIMRDEESNAAAESYVFDVTEADFEQSVLVASTQGPVLVDFWAPWCGPCKQLTPVLEKVVASYQGAVRLAKVNTDEQQQLAAIFGIRSLPTVMLLKDGRPIDGFMGVQPESAIRALIEKHAGAPPEPAAPAAPAVPADPAARLAQARALLAQEPDQEAHRLPLIAALIDNGLADEASTELDRLPPDLAESDVAKKARSQLSFAAVLAGAPGEPDLRAAIAKDPAALRARHQLGTRLLLTGDDEGALAEFLEIMRRDRKFDDDVGRKALIAAFDLVADPELVSRTRRQMASILF